MTLPNFVVIGAPKAGTTALARYLGDHRDGFVAKAKEVHYFDRDGKYSRGVEWYEAQFEGYQGERAVGDATPGYMYSREAIDRMAKLLPDVRLIATLRNPVDRAYSQYWSNRSRGGEPRSFEEVMAADATSNTQLIKGFNRAYAGRSRYLTHLEYVCERFDRSQLLVLLFDDMRKDPSATYASVCRFLDIDDANIPSTVGEPFGHHREFRSLRLQNAMLGSRIPRRYLRPIMNANTRHTSYPKLTADERGRYEQMFSDDNAALAAWLQRDLGMWMAANDPASER